MLSQFNTEALKLAAMGVTISVSSGDDGVANVGCACDRSKGVSVYNCACQANSGKSASSWKGSNSWSGFGYFPSFPATCPYVTAVGATMGNGGGGASSIGSEEIACQVSCFLGCQ